MSATNELLPADRTMRNSFHHDYGFDDVFVFCLAAATVGAAFSATAAAEEVLAGRWWMGKEMMRRSDGRRSKRILIRIRRR